MAQTQNRELRQRIRLAEKNVDGNQSISKALSDIKGLGVIMARAIALKYAKTHGMELKTPIGYMSDEEITQLEQVIKNPTKHGIPAYMVNQQNDLETGEDKHLIMSALDLNYRTRVKDMQDARSYKGLRQAWGLTVRGQRTKSTGRKNSKKAKYRLHKSEINKKRAATTAAAAKK